MMALADMAQASATQSMAMLANASVVWSGHECRAIFNQPGETVIGDMVMMTDFQITLLTADLPGISQGEEISITPDATGLAVTFETRARQSGVDGYLSVIGLTEA
jgi:hypothetical protein